MEEILHITTRAEWDRAVALGEYRADSLATEGFIHASTPRQVAASAGRFYRGRTDLIVLRIDPGLVAAEIRRETSPHSAEPFPHLYGPLNLSAVVEVVPLSPDESGGVLLAGPLKFSDGPRGLARLLLFVSSRRGEPMSELSRRSATLRPIHRTRTWEPRS